MSRGWKVFTAVTLSLVLIVAGVALTLPWWLPQLAGMWLPAGTHVALDGRPGWRNGKLVLPGIRYFADDCALAAASHVTLGRQSGRWQLAADTLTLDRACLSHLPAAEHPSAPRTFAEWQAMLPAADITVAKLTLVPWTAWSGALKLNLDSRQQHFTWRSANLSLEASLSGQTLDLASLRLQTPGLTEPVQIAGTIQLPELPDSLPDEGRLAAGLALEGFPAPLQMTLTWQQQQGSVVLLQQGERDPLMTLPWQASGDRIDIHQGQWRWPYAMQPLSGGVSLSLQNWRQGISATEITGRLNVLTQGRGGKGNVVLTLGPGHLDLLNSALPFRITGVSKLAQLQFYAGLPGEVQGPLLDPKIRLAPGALLRMKGRLLSTLEVDEARWPLAGVTLSQAGIDGRLQAILSAHDAQMGRFRLHLDGEAKAFWPDRGRWRWRYWGEGFMAPLAARWDVSGRGRWQERLIELSALSTGFDHIHYGSVNVDQPRLILSSPVRWLRDPAHPAFSGGFTFSARQTDFSNGGYLPPATLRVNLKGRDPSDFLYDGDLQAEAIGPVRVQGRWDGARLRGQGWWPQQPLSVFQPLLSEDLKMHIQSGQLKAQVAFSAASKQGFEAGGHWVVSDGSVRTPDNEITGVNFSLPFRLKDHLWHFGAKQPVSLRIREIKNQFSLQNITADLQGWYPWSARQPLQLSNVSVDLLGGSLSMASLQMPQTEAALMRLNQISLSELIAAIKPKQIAMSGHVNGELPLWLTHPRWLIKDGWLANSGPLTVRLNNDFADAISSNNIAAGAAMDWLRYMEISRSWATLDLDNLGALTMKAQVEGTSRFSDKNQRVSLNYTQQENLFQLWRSLRFGDNLQSWVEQHATLPPQKGNSDETH
ncbi:YdbH family protein [Erwinia sp. P6884]|uniref:YdbH family protein n=1 Tax=Erwinia sp. P6884 TaxID=3141450 RepID=UPI003195B68C